MKIFKKVGVLYLAMMTSINISACANISGNISEKSDENTEIMAGISEILEIDGYKQISQDYAKKIMDSDANYIILDVREQDEYNESHIPGAILIPHTEIDETVESILQDKDQIILVYCRSGRRSKIASVSLVSLGYTAVYEFGGIIDWKYEIE